MYIYTYPHECFDGLGSTHRRRSWPARSVPTLNKTRARRHLSGARRKLRRAVYRCIQVLYSAESKTAQRFNCTMTCLYVQPPKLRNSNPCPAGPPCESLLECVGTNPSTVIGRPIYPRHRGFQEVLVSTSFRERRVS